jgi:hypothetical protein
MKCKFTCKTCFWHLNSPINFCNYWNKTEHDFSGCEDWSKRKRKELFKPLNKKVGLV